jgi:hypothetical protein
MDAVLRFFYFFVCEHKKSTGVAGGSCYQDILTAARKRHIANKGYLTFLDYRKLSSKI